ncbi:MAG: phenylalanine--tRNA ligase subunit beta [Candidatus Micrarchaeota archaeon]|nr:phenylalanine--tRNA ligase subunit beta [Candidatus Micrarchaeota archaeon]
MPVSIHDKKYMLKLLGFKVSDEELVRNIENMGPNVKRIDAKEIEVEYPANRPDLISTLGLSRAVRYYMRKSRSFAYKIKQGEALTISVGSHVAVRPYIAALVVDKMQLGEDDLLDMINFTEKLSSTYGRQRGRIALGLHDMREVKGPLLYDAFEDEEFIPLGSKSKMRYSTVMDSDKRGRKYIGLCRSGGRYVALKDQKGTMSLIPVINSERTRVSAGTKRMLVDITGTTREVIERVADLLAADFMDRGFEVSRVSIRYRESSRSLPKMETRRFSIPLKQIDDELGVTVGFNNAIVLANKMGHEAALIGKKIAVSAAPYRLDIINEQDVIEDIAVGYGYDYIQPVPVPSSAIGRVEARSEANNSAREIMIGLGFGEAMNSYLTNEETNFAKMRHARETEYIDIVNPRSGMATMLRTWILPSLLRQLGQSMHDSFPLRIFELDMVFGIRRNVPAETYHLAAVSCHSQANFNEAKASLEGLLRGIGVACKFAEGRDESMIEGRCATVESDGKIIGFLGEIHPEVLTSFGIEEPTVGFEIDLNGWIGAESADSV